MASTAARRRRAWRAGIVLFALGALGALGACTQEFPPPPPDAPVVYAPRILVTIGFDFDSARIKPEYYSTLDNIAAAFRDPSLAGARFDINGHTDITGRFGYNVALSLLRARAVVNYLAARGIPPELMHAQGFGPLQLADPANPRSPINRRVEIVAIH
jgi:outer membrane protein OmpA-like peptidoglycan-associated protein